MTHIHRDYPDHTIISGTCIIHNLLYVDHQFTEAETFTGTHRSINQTHKHSMYPGESISLKTPHYLYIILIESCNNTKHNTSHKYLHLLHTIQLRFDLQISPAACLPPLLNTSSRTDENSFPNSILYCKIVTHTMLDVSNSYNIMKIREQTHWHTQSFDCANHHAQL